jgi:putative membrane protein
MAQHELLMLLGAPLVVLGRPITAWLWALPQSWRARAGASLQPRGAGRLWRAATMPVVAWALHGLAVWVWHAPPLYEAAVEHEPIHFIQHATFLGTAVLFWWGLVYGRYGRVAYGASVLYVFTTMVHTGILGAVLALSTSPLMPVYRDRAAAAGIDAVVDQQLAGLIMWIPAGVILTLSGLILISAWIQASEHRAHRGRLMLVALLPLALAAGSACRQIPYAEEVREATGGDPYRGRERIHHYGCDSCHTIPGIPTADATVGPPLTAVARRVYLAGHVKNTPENMVRWIENPPAHEPQTAMPNMGVSEQDSRDIVAYLYTLR